MHLIEKMTESGVDALSLDSPETVVDLKITAQKVSEQIILMRNINPTGTIFSGTTEKVEEEVIGLLERIKPFKNYILRIGYDLPQNTPAENIKAFMSADRNFIMN